MTTLTLYAGAGDCYGSDGGGFTSTSNKLEIGNISSSDYPARAWIPFSDVIVPQGTTITSATLKLVASQSSSGTTVKVKIGCEDADNPSQPTSWSEINSRVLTSDYTSDAGIATWVEGTEYTYTITTAVQEVINRAGFTSGNKIAVLIHDNGSTADAARSIASEENASYTEAILVIVYSGGSSTTPTPSSAKATTALGTITPAITYNQPITFRPRDTSLTYEARDD